MRDNRAVLCAIALLLILPASRPADAIDRAAARARAGDAAGALALLSDTTVTDTERAVVAIIRARAYVLQGRWRLANSALSVYAQTRGNPPALDAVAAELALDAAWARSSWDPVRPHAVLDAVAALDRHPLPEHIKRHAQLRAAIIEARLPEHRASALHRLAPLTDPRALDLRASLETGAARAALERRIVVEHPASPAGRARLDQVPALNLADQLARARRLFSRRAYDLAEPAWAAVGRLTDDPAVRQEAALVRGTIELRVFGDAAKAAGWLAGAARGPDRDRAAEALFRQGIALGRLAQWDAGIVAMRAAVARHPRGRYAQGAAYEIGRLMHEAGRFSESAAQTAAFLRERRRRDPAKYRWFEGWSHFRAGSHRKARRVFEKLAKSDNLLVGPKALYWIARSHAASKNPKAALKTLKRLRKRSPWSYYGVLGDTLARRLDPQGYRPPRRPARLHRTPEVADLRSWLPFTGLRTLARAGYPRRAPLPDTIRDPLTRASVRHAAERFGVRWKAVADRRLPWRVGLEKAPADQVAAAYPNAYWLLAEAAGRPHGVSPWWLLGHMLQESRFKARARSHAGALGPMQVLPRTGLRIAARLGLPRGDFSADQLFAPGIALRHAAWYLAALRTEFGGNILLAIAAYNGGPLRFAAHVETCKDLPFDVMIEEIGAHESRNYVRKVADHLIRFALIYADDAEFLGLIDAIRPPARVPSAQGQVRF